MASTTGELELVAWDIDYANNSGTQNVSVTIGPPKIPQSVKDAANSQVGQDYAEALVYSLLATAAAAVPSTEFLVPYFTDKALLAGAEAVAAAKIANDPIDPNFTNVAYPLQHSVSLPPLQAPMNVAEYEAFGALHTNSLQILAISGALLTAIDRAQGAAAAGNIDWQIRQLKYAGLWSSQLSRLYSQKVVLVKQLASAWQASSQSAININQSDALSFQESLLTNGLPSGIASGLASLGLSTIDIQSVLDNLEVATVPASASFPSVLTNPQALTTYNAMASSLASFASALPLLGDLNGDGVVNCVDLDIVKAAFDTRVGEVGYNAAADVNADGVVNLIDLSTVAEQLAPGTTCN